MQKITFVHPYPGNTLVTVPLIFPFVLAPLFFFDRFLLLFVESTSVFYVTAMLTIITCRALALTAPWI